MLHAVQLIDGIKTTMEINAGFITETLVIVTPQNHPLASVEKAFFEDVLKPEPA